MKRTETCWTLDAEQKCTGLEENNEEANDNDEKTIAEQNNGDSRCRGPA